MPTISFEFAGGKHTLSIPHGELYELTASDIIEGLCYPLPKNNHGPLVRSVVDLGAHVGEFTILAAARWPLATIHAFEPNPQVLELLEVNCRPYQNIIIHPQAVDVKARKDKLYFNQLGSVGATVVRPRDEDKPSPECEWSGVEVDIVGPDAVLVHKPDVLKIDIEGPEGVLLEAIPVSARCLIHRIYVEFHHENIRQHIERLLIPTHTLEYARILQSRQGELMYVRRPH